MPCCWNFENPRKASPGSLLLVLVSLYVTQGHDSLPLTFSPCSRILCSSLSPQPAPVRSVHFDSAHGLGCFPQGSAKLDLRSLLCAGPLACGQEWSVLEGPPCGRHPVFPHPTAARGVFPAVCTRGNGGSERLGSPRRVTQLACMGSTPGVCGSPSLHLCALLGQALGR